MICYFIYREPSPGNQGSLTLGRLTGGVARPFASLSKQGQDGRRESQIDLRAAESPPQRCVARPGPLQGTGSGGLLGSPSQAEPCSSSRTTGRSAGVAGQRAPGWQTRLLCGPPHVPQVPGSFP